jgi:hypothetical protein
MSDEDKKLTRDPEHTLNIVSECEEKRLRKLTWGPNNAWARRWA